MEENLYKSKNFSIPAEKQRLFCKTTEDQNLDVIHPPIVPAFQAVSLGLKGGEQKYGKRLHEIISKKGYRLVFRLEGLLTDECTVNINIDISNGLEMNLLSQNTASGLKSKLVPSEKCKGKIGKGKLIELSDLVVDIQTTRNFVESLFVITTDHKEKKGYKFFGDEFPVYKLLLCRASHCIMECQEKKKIKFDETLRYIYIRQEMELFPSIFDIKIGDTVHYKIRRPRKNNFTGFYGTKIYHDKTLLAIVFSKLGRARGAAPEFIDQTIAKYQAKLKKR